MRRRPYCLCVESCNPSDRRLSRWPHRVAIRAGKLIDGKSEKPLENVLIVTEGDRSRPLRLAGARLRCGSN